MCDGGIVIPQVYTHPMDWRPSGSSRWPTLCSGDYGSSDVSDKWEEGGNRGREGEYMSEGSTFLWVRGGLGAPNPENPGPTPISRCLLKMLTSALAFCARH